MQVLPLGVVGSGKSVVELELKIMTPKPENPWGRSATASALPLLA